MGPVILRASSVCLEQTGPAPSRALCHNASPSNEVPRGRMAAI